MAELYQTQRAMRNMRRAALQRGVIGILDIGTSKIACLVLRFDGTGTFRETDGVGPMAGQVNFRVIGAASTRSRGMRRGEIETMAETERAIRTVVAAAQKLAGVRIDHVIACMSGGRRLPTVWRARRRWRRARWTTTTWPRCWPPATCPISAEAARCCTRSP